MSWIIPSDLPYPIEIIDVRQLLPVNPKGGWEDFKEVRNINKLTRIMLHHDAVYKDKSGKQKADKYTDLELMTNIATSHINSTKNRKDGDGGFPYHAFIRSGKVYITNNMEAFTYGVANNNGYTIHICVHGNYTMETMSEENKKALVSAIILAKRSMPAFYDIKGHNELTATECPAYDVSSVIREVAKVEQEILDNLTRPSAAAEAYQMANQFLYYYNMFAEGKDSKGNPVNEGQRSWALQQVLSLKPEMKRLGMIK